MKLEFETEFETGKQLSLQLVCHWEATAVGDAHSPPAPQEHPDRAFLGLSCRPLATSWGRPGALLGRPEILPGDLSGALFVPSQQFLGICRVALLELPRFLGPRRLSPARARVEVASPAAISQGIPSRLKQKLALPRHGPALMENTCWMQ